MRILKKIFNKIKSIILKITKTRCIYLILKQIKPISNKYGFDRGKPIDRYHIENFLETNKKDIKGSCLEILNNDYTLRFGNTRVIRSDILDIDLNNKNATIYGDIKNLKHIKDDSYDCIILTQVLQFIDDYESAIRECHRILKPWGCILATVPSVSRIDCAAGISNDYWRFTEAGAKYSFSKFFKVDNLEVKAFGNALVGLSFWIGLAQHELTKEKLDYIDPNFPYLVTVKATKR